jgi:FMN phosphatase YigB (HAD superfamily)
MGPMRPMRPIGADLIRTIFFDFGNVLAFFDHQRAIRELVRHSDLPAAELMRILHDTPLAEDYETGRISTDEYVRKALHTGRLSCPPETFLTHFCDIFWRNPEVCDLIPALLPRYRVVLASNTVDAHFNRYCADYADVLGRFHHLVASHHAGARKPHPRFFEYAHRFAEAEPGECLFIDDLAANVATAVEFGWRGLVYRADGTLADKLRDAGIEIGKT